MNQRTLAIVTIVLGILLVISLGLLVLFGVSLANADKVKKAEISSSLAAQEKQLKAEFQTEKEQTLATYTAPDSYGSFTFDYPKVWSTYFKQEEGAREALTFYGDPNPIVFDRSLGGPFTAVKMLVYSDKYETKVKDIRSRYITGSKSPYKESDIVVSSVSGKKYIGVDRETKKSVAFILLPLRDKTLFIGTDDSEKYTSNLDKIVKSFNINK